MKQLLSDFKLFKRTLFFLLPMLLLSYSALAQDDFTVTGTVTDEYDAPLPGASVVEKGTSNGVQTDFDGKYLISVKTGQAKLVVSYIGFGTKEISVNNQSTVNISLEESSSELEEVVVIGYGTSKKSDVTGSLVRVKTEKTEALNNTNILQSLKGSVAGLSVGTPDRPGEEPSFRIRGTNSIGPRGNNEERQAFNLKNQPLIVVDGVIFKGSLNDINSADVASVDILKDASSAAVYGSRSANGVIIVTTKKGTSDKPLFNFSTSYGVSDPVSLIPVLDGDQYIQKILDVRVAQGVEANPNNINDYLTITESNNLNAGRTVDWYDKLVQTATTQTYSGSVSGRTEKSNYFVSGSYNTQEGIVENDNFDRLSMRVNLSQNITDWFKLSVNSSYSYLDYSGVAVPLSYGLSPYSNFYETGSNTETLEFFPMEDPFFRHPFLEKQIDDQDTRSNLWGLVSAEIKIPFVKGLKWTINYSASNNVTKKFEFRDNTLAIPQNGEAKKRITENYNWLFDNILNYNRVFSDVHSVSGTFLISREHSSFSETRANATNFFNQGLGFNSLELGQVPEVNSDFEEQDQNAIMGRLGYVYDNRYALTATIRRDGFSGFGEGNKFATFLSAGASWNIANEKFLEDVSWVNQLKLRFSYGENGNQAIGRYQTLARLSTRPYVFGDGSGTSIGVFTNSLANSNLGWETTTVNNIGMDFSLFQSALTGSFDYYNSKTEDILLTRNIPSLTGFETILTNIGGVRNKGFEVALNTRPYSNENFSWNIGVVFDLNRNTIESLFGVDDDGDGVEDDDVANSWFIGKPFGAIYGFATDGIYQTNDTDIPEGYQPGDFRIVDTDNDGELTPDDRQILGYDLPSYQFGVTNTLTYKNWSLLTTINSIQGGGSNNYYVGDNIHGHNPNSRFASWSERFSFPQMDYWTPDNPSNTAARVTYVPTRSHPYLEDRSFVRIQDVILSYSFDKDVLDKIKMSGMRLYVTGKNIYTFSDWNGYDPENGTTIVDSPLLRTFTLGLDLKF
ncbi:hypothetical protein B4Q04_19725 [Zobellia sp. OII3]|uniref:SusC/RagA family TonB-linked outer membrane protein n=1 Tax=Zobellia sp. OII3 TaxID=2034520 RepID=UPI000B533CE4|nr:TonB-dependent receptor [Zobellia sp. OII3]OWW23562.1 hypothetical protein B4Q04_19725 [Zobellia sp. OII3]